MNSKKQPLYLKAKNKIIEWILSGKYGEGDKLPPERELVEILKVSRITVLAALRELANDGRVIRRQGSGTYVGRSGQGHAVRLSGTEVKITFGINGYHEFLYLFKYLIRMFREEHPGVDVEPVSVRMSTGLENDPYIVSIASGNVPTVGEFYMHADYAAINGLQPLEELPGFQDIECDIKRECLKRTLDADSNLHVHALPYRVNPKVLVVNASMLAAAGIDAAQPPASFGELLEWLEKAGRHASALKTDHYGFHIDPTAHCESVISYYPYLWAADGFKPAACKEEFLALLDGEARWLKFMLQAFSVGRPCLQGSWLELFQAGRIGMLLSDPGRAVQMSKTVYPNFELRTMRIPPFRKGGAATTSIGDMSLGIFRAGVKSDKELDAAWQWLRFILRPDVQEVIAHAYWNIPAMGNAPLPYPDDAQYALYADVINSGKAQYDFKDIRKVLTIFAREIGRCLSGEITPEACMQNAKSRIRENIY